MKLGIKCKIGDLACVKAADFRTAIDYFKLHLDTALRALEVHMDKKGQPMHTLDNCVATIELEGNFVKFVVRDEEDSDKENMPYFSKITFPAIGNLSTFNIQED